MNPCIPAWLVRWRRPYHTHSKNGQLQAITTHTVPSLSRDANLRGFPVDSHVDIFLLQVEECNRKVASSLLSIAPRYCSSENLTIWLTPQKVSSRQKKRSLWDRSSFPSVPFLKWGLWPRNVLFLERLLMKAGVPMANSLSMAQCPEDGHILQCKPLGSLGIATRNV